MSDDPEVPADDDEVFWLQEQLDAEAEQEAADDPPGAGT